MFKKLFFAILDALLLLFMKIKKIACKVALIFLALFAIFLVILSNTLGVSDDSKDYVLLIIPIFVLVYFVSLKISFFRFIVWIFHGIFSVKRRTWIS